MATVLAKLHLHGNDRIRRLDRKQIMILRKNEHRHSIHRPPKTPISEVWSKIDKDSKSRPEPITSTQLNRSIRPEISIFKKKEYQQSIQRARKPPYARFGQKSTKMRKVDQKRSVRGCRIDRFDLKYRFSRKTNSAIRFSAPENPISEVRSKIDKDSKSRPMIDIASDRSVQKTQNKHQATSIRIPSFHLSPRTWKLVQGVLRNGWYKKALRTEGKTEGRTKGFCTPISKANSLHSLRERWT